MDPVTGEVCRIDAKWQGERVQDVNQEAALKGQIDLYRQVVIGCVAALCSKVLPNLGGISKVYNLFCGNDASSACLLDCARYGVTGAPIWARTGMADEEPGWDLDSFESWDAALTPTRPRLFLYSDRDALISRDKVEAYIRHTQRYAPNAEVLSTIIPKAVHCQLWTKDLAKCGAAVEELIRKVETLDLDSAQ